MEQTPAAVPPHIAADRVIDYDVYKGETYAASGDLHEALYSIAEKNGRGIFWTPRNGGHWIINDYALAFEAARATDLFSSSKMTIPPVPVEPKLIPLYLDPPEHAAFRAPLAKAFSPHRILAMQADIRGFAIELIEAIAGQRQCDFVQAIAEPFPIKIFMRLMGMPFDRLREFRNWILDMLSSDDARRESSYANIYDLMDGLIRERESKPCDDLISTLLATEIESRPVTYDEVQAFCLLLFAAGLDTVANALAFGMNHVAGDPQLQDRLRADPSRIPHAIEELLRKYGVPMPARTAARDFAFGGVEIKQGERILLALPAANLDPRRFRDPFKFDIDRPNRAHLTFNVGPHRCVGSHLARMELRIFWEEWFRRMPDVRRDPEAPWRLRSGLTLAVEALPLRW